MSIDKRNELALHFYMPTKGSKENTKIELLHYIFFVLYFETTLKNIAYGTKNSLVKP